MVTHKEPSMQIALENAAASLERGEVVDFFSNELRLSNQAAALLQNLEASNADKAACLRSLKQYHYYREITEALALLAIKEVLANPSFGNIVPSKSSTPSDPRTRAQVSSVFAWLFTLASGFFWLLTALAYAGAFVDSEVESVLQQQMRVQEALLFGSAAGSCMLCCVLLFIYSHFLSRNQTQKMPQKRAESDLSPTSLSPTREFLRIDA